MDWVKLYVRYYVDERIEALPDADTEMMFVRGLGRAGELRREGFIPEESLPKLARKRRYAASVSALLASGLWTKVDGGYQITNWDHWQDALDALAKRRAADRERQRRRRASEGEQTVKSTTSRDKQGLSRDSRSRDHFTSWDRSSGIPNDDSHAQRSDQRKQGTSRDNADLSRDVSRDVTPPRVRERERPPNGSNAANGRTARAQEPLPPDEPSGAAERIITTWIDSLTKRPQRVMIDQIGRHVAAALADGQDPTDVAEGLRLWQTRGDLGPGALPTLIHQVANHTPSQRLPALRDRASPNSHRESTTDARVRDGAALMAELAREETDEPR